MEQSKKWFYGFDHEIHYENYYHCRENYCINVKTQFLTYLLCANDTITHSLINPEFMYHNIQTVQYS
jgi:hypothetical protein